MSKYVRIGHPWIDESEAPLYQWTFPSELTDEEITRCLMARERWAKEARYPVAWVVDLSNLGSVNARHRRLFGEHLERFEPHDVAWNQGSAIVVPNALLRGIVTAVFWIKTPRFPNQLFATRDEARGWARDVLSRAPRGNAAQGA